MVILMRASLQYVSFLLRWPEVAVLFLWLFHTRRRILWISVLSLVCDCVLIVVCDFSPCFPFEVSPFEHFPSSFNRLSCGLVDLTLAFS
jgi:hypothetical protein